jgi:hypothetical protein
MMKKVLLAISILIFVLFALGAVLVLILDNSNLKPSKNYVTDYISPTSPYAVKTLYDENKSPIDIIIIDAKSGVSRAGISQDAYSYEIKEVSSTMKFTLRDNEGVITGEYKFDTKKGEWVDLHEISDEPSSNNEKKNDSPVLNFKQ